LAPFENPVGGLKNLDPGLLLSDVRRAGENRYRELGAGVSPVAALPAVTDLAESVVDRFAEGRELFEVAFASVSRPS
jgi:hypothetical protein